MTDPNIRSLTWDGAMMIEFRNRFVKEWADAGHSFFILQLFPSVE